MKGVTVRRLIGWKQVRSSLEVRLDGGPSGWPEGWEQVWIHARHNRIRIVKAVGQAGGDLAVTKPAVIDVLSDESERIVDHGPVPWEYARRRQGGNSFERRDIGTQSAARAGRNHDSRAQYQHVAGVEVARGLVPEADVIRCVARRVNGREDVITGVDPLAF